MTESTRTLIAALVVVAPARADEVFVAVLVIVAGGAGVRVAFFVHCSGSGRFCDWGGKKVLLLHALTTLKSGTNGQDLPMLTDLGVAISDHQSLVRVKETKSRFFLRTSFFRRR